ncbi:MAG: hypothetical protein ACRCUC_13065 [Aestuariivirga sp.]
MARPRNEDKPVEMLCVAAVLPASILPSIEMPVHRGDTFTVTRKEADALELFGYASEIQDADD